MSSAAAGSAGGTASPIVPPVPTVPTVQDDDALLPSGVRLALRRHVPALSRSGGGEGGGRPFLLVHGLASNTRMWDGVAARLAAAGHPVLAVDLRGHGRSAELEGGAPEAGYDTPTCADDLAALIAQAWPTTTPVVAGQSWGGQVVFALAARHPGAVAAVAGVDGGWLRLGASFATFEECWATLAPHDFEGLTWDALAERIRAGHEVGWPPGAADAVLANLRRTGDGGVRAALRRDRHRSILESMFSEDPREWFRQVSVPVLLCAASAPGERPDLADALAGLPRATVRWYPGAHHDVHLQRPDDIAADLLALAADIPTAGGTA